MDGGGRATIMHADLDAFFASVEQRDDPSLRGRPIAVGGGVVLAASYEAKRYGVRGGMGGRQAQRLCPGLQFVPGRFHAYSEASKAVFKVFDDTSPLVEGISIDEAFLDVGGLGAVRGTPEQVARRLRTEVKERVGLNITVGIARTKFLAKVASGVAKPDGLLVVEPDGERDFLHPLPVGRLWGVGPKTTDKLHKLGIRTVADVAGLSEDVLIGMLGPASGRSLHALAHNRDPRRVQARKRRGSIGAQRALGRGPHAFADVDAALAGLVDRVSRRMRRADRTGRTVVLRLRFADFVKATRSTTLLTPTSATPPLLDAARRLLVAARPEIASRGITLVGVAVSNLDSEGSQQLELPLTDSPAVAHAHDLDAALDGVRERFGSTAITRGTLVHRGAGYEMPHLAD